MEYLKIKKGHNLTAVLKSNKKLTGPWSNRNYTLFSLLLLFEMFSYCKTSVPREGTLYARSMCCLKTTMFKCEMTQLKKKKEKKKKI